MRRATGAVSRADVLHLLAQEDASSDTTARLAALLGFERVVLAKASVGLPAVVVEAPEVRVLPPPVEEPLPLEFSSPKAPLRAVFRDVLFITPLPGDDEPTTAQAETGAPAPARVEPLTLADCQPRQRHGEPPWHPLARPLVLAAALKPALQRTHPAGVDVGQLVQALAQGRLLGRLPRLKRGRWPSQVRLVVDISERLQPYRRDFDVLVNQLLGLGGGLEVRGRRVSDVPPLPDAQGASGAWLILSDVGTLAGRRSLQGDWLAWAREIQRRGGEVQVWLPHAGRGLWPAWRGVADVRALGGAHPGQQVKASADDVAPAQRLAVLLERLLVRASCCVHLDTGLLRTLRLSDARLRHEPALESLYWAHAQVERSRVSRPVTPSFAPTWRQRLAAEFSAAERLVLWRTVYEAHAWRGRSTEVAEVLLWHTHAGAGLEEEAEPQQAREAAQAWLSQLAASALTGSEIRDLRAFAADWLGRQWHDTVWQQQHSRDLAAVWLVSGVSETPEGVAPEDLHRAQLQGQDARQEAGPCTLVERADGLWLWPRATLAQAQGFELGAGRLSLLGEVLVGEGTPGAGLRWRRLNAGQAPVVLAAAREPWPVEVWCSGQRFELGLWARPSWATSFGQDRKGQLWAGLLTPKGQNLAVPLRTQKGDRWLVDLGEDPFGLFLDFTLKAERGRVVQRFRWIEPGSFLMGSPETEPARSSDEGPQHRVTLTQGFWLADTACTQALWLAVVGGENPSKFKGNDELPVEQVCWDDVMKEFMPKLQALLPQGVEATLPNEAQWEYACRAGTQTPFSFGEQVKPKQVNYDGRYPYNNGPKGEYREKTVPVKALLANAWGLFQMHGNVWEWCFDGRRTYAEGETVDPLGAVGDGSRALRGGCWESIAWNTRSAFRDGLARVRRDGLSGFRVALRFKPSQGAEPQTN